MDCMCASLRKRERKMKKREKSRRLRGWKATWEIRKNGGMTERERERKRQREGREIRRIHAWSKSESKSSSAPWSTLTIKSNPSSSWCVWFHHEFISILHPCSHMFHTSSTWSEESLIARFEGAFDVESWCITWHSLSLSPRTLVLPSAAMGCQNNGQANDIIYKANPNAFILHFGNPGSASQLPFFFFLYFFFLIK